MLLEARSLDESTRPRLEPFQAALLADLVLQASNQLCDVRIGAGRQLVSQGSAFGQQIGLGRHGNNNTVNSLAIDGDHRVSPVKLE